MPRVNVLMVREAEMADNTTYMSDIESRLFASALERGGSV